MRFFSVTVLVLGIWTSRTDAAKPPRDALVEQRRIIALPVTEKVALDGELNEAAWKRAEPATDFLQIEPRHGDPSTERTEVRILYDDTNLYVGAFCFDSTGKDQFVVQDVNEDFMVWESDSFQIMLDTLNDNRNGFTFSTNPEGARADTQVGNDGTTLNRDWDSVWYVKTKKTSSGWQFEMAIPFKTLRFRSRETHVWGVNFLRRIRRRNEEAIWSLPPRPHGVNRVSEAGVLEGIQGVEQGRNLYVKPYLAIPVTRRERDDVDFVPDVGWDLKYGVTSQLTLDLTANTDFSQVEADEQQVNLTRFSLFFPEKREFFLENSQIFQFRQRMSFGAGRSGSQRELIPFFSRRIGVSKGQIVPILGGVRLTGRLGSDLNLGFLSMQTDQTAISPSTNFSVLRLRKDLFRNSDIGGILINKEEEGGHFNRTLGMDANFHFFRYLDVWSYVLKTRSPGSEGDDMAGNVRVAWIDRLFDLEGSFLSIQDNFDPEVGFVPRHGIRKTRADLALTPRPGDAIPWIREIQPAFHINYITDQNNRLETRELDASINVTFQNGSNVLFSRESTLDRLSSNTVILGETIAPGDYRFRSYLGELSSDQSRILSGTLRLQKGDFYGGEKGSYFLEGRFRPNPYFGVEFTWDKNKLEFSSRHFSTDLITGRVSYSLSTNLFLNALVQYNSELREVSSNIRLNYIYRPLNNFFLVYNERRSSTGEVLERALTAKLTYLLSF